MELQCFEREKVDIASARVYVAATERKILLASVAAVAYAFAIYECLDTAGGAHDDALERIRRKNRENFVNKTDPKMVLPDNPLPFEWAPAAWAGLLLGTVIVLHVFFHLMCYWRPSFLAKTLFKPAVRVREGCRVHVVPTPNRGSEALVTVRRSELTGHDGFEFQRLRYEVVQENGKADEADDDEDLFIQRVPCPTDKLIEHYMKSRGLDEDDVLLHTEQYGQNLLAVAIPSFFTCYKEQILSPLVVFQLFLSLLWAMDDYISYTLMQIFFTLMLESTTVFQRQSTMKTLNGMSVKPFPVKAYRDGKWEEVNSIDLLPGDLIQLTVEKPEPLVAAEPDKQKPAAAPVQNLCIVPCDCILLRGEVVVNEASLTGESVPQMKEQLILDDPLRALDFEGADATHFMSSGTSPMSVKAGDMIKTGLGSTLPETPDGGCLCFVLRTGFSSSQGKLLQMIEFSSDRRAVKADEKEMTIALLVLLGFALCSASYVMKKGLEAGDKTLYELVLKCVIIVSSVVPRSLPMTMAVAVNTALMSLMKAGVFCTEPHRVPSGGKLTHALFDKTGTITTDTLALEGIINPTESDTSAAENHGLVMVRNSSPEAAAVLGACHSLMSIEGHGLLGDPIDIAALRAVGWSFDAAESTARPCTAEPKQQVLEAAKSELESLKKKVYAAPDKAAEEKLAKEDLVRQAEEALDEAKKADKENCIEFVKILQRFRFASKLQRSSTVVNLSMREGKATDNLKTGLYVLAKGAPEAIHKLLAPGAAPSWYEQRYKDLAEHGMRVLALAYKPLSGCDKSENAIPNREDAEKELMFAGFITFSCRMRADSELVISSLRESAHIVAMVTGDSPLTALHVARKCGIVLEKSEALVLQVPEASNGTTPPVVWAVAAGERRGQVQKFSAMQMPDLVRSGDIELMVTEAALRVAVEQDPELWQQLDHVRVFARMTPQGKTDIISHMQKQGSKVLMCGDGGNDMGALKQADVGLALLSGYGNVNTESKSENPSPPQLPQSDGGQALAVQSTPILAEDRLNANQKELQKRERELVKEKQRLFKEKQGELQAKQKVWLEEELARREAAGEPTGIMAQAGIMKDIVTRFTKELVTEQKELNKKFGNAYEKQEKDPFKKLLGDIEGEDGSGGMQAPGGMPMVRPGDASMAAAFTSRVPSIKSTIDLIRQGRCALLSALQQQQITMLHCLINAYVLSALSLEGSRSSERQLMASSWLLSTASIAFSYARPCDKMHPVRPLRSLFHKAIFFSMLGQAAMHLGCLVFATKIARDAMDPESQIRKDGIDVGPSLANVSEFWKKQRLIRRGLLEAEVEEEELGIVEMAMQQWEYPFLPNLMNTVVFLVETSQQVGVLAVNYKGQPWMKGLVENRPLFLSIFILFVAVYLCAWEMVPQANQMIHLSPFPGDEFRWQILGMVVVSIFGTFAWDRFCVWLFAPEIFTAMVDSAKKTTFKDDILPIITDCGKIVLGVCLFMMGVPGWIGLFIWYRNRKKEE